MKRRRVKKGPVLFTFLLLIILIFGCLYLFKDLFSKSNDNNDITELNKEEKPKVYSGTITLAGDVMINSNMWYDTITNEGTYDYEYVFEDLKSSIKQSNVSLYKQESIVGGKDLGASLNYVFNSPIDQLVSMKNMGFNMVALASYQSYDKGLDGITNTLTSLKDNNLLYAGISDSETNRLKNNTITKNGITYGLLSYTLGTDTEYLDTYLIDKYSEVLVKSDVDNLRKDADVIIVYIDWTDIDSEEVTEEQTEIATYLSEIGVNIVVGNTGYTIQPIQMIDNTLVYYSIGNLLTGHTSIDSRISIISDLKVTVTKTDDETTVEFSKINALFTFAYNQYKTNYKVLPFTKITNELSSYETYYDKYSTLLTTNNENINVYELGDSNGN